MLILLIIFGIYLISSEHLFFHIYLIFHERPLSYRNQSIDLLCKSLDWFLYDNGLCHERVKFVYVHIFIYQPLIAKKYFPNI